MRRLIPSAAVFLVLSFIVFGCSSRNHSASPEPVGNPLPRSPAPISPSQNPATTGGATNPTVVPGSIANTAVAPGPLAPGQSGQSSPGSPPATARLAVSGAHLVSADGQPIQLRGMSSHGLQWYGQFMNQGSIQWLHDQWQVSLIRAAMYTVDGGYIDNPALIAKVYEIADAAIALQMYVLVDWHILDDGDPMTHISQASDFFSQVSKHYGDNPYVLYEICNEPNGVDVSWAGNIAPYARQIIPIIRGNAPNSIIVVGTPQWDSQLGDVLKAPLPFANVMYTQHFYSGSDGSGQRSAIAMAVQQGLPIFVSEWGVSADTGDGGIFPDEAQKWVTFMSSNSLSWADWSVSDKNESSAMVLPGSAPTGGWTQSDLSAAGQLMQQFFLASEGPKRVTP